MSARPGMSLLDGEPRKRRLEMADRGPVHRTLTSETRVETRLAPG